MGENPTCCVQSENCTHILCVGLILIVGICANEPTAEICANRSAATRGTCPLRHASRPSMARSVADVLSAHGLREQVPHIPANGGGFKQ
jgi:hypothetical protein